MKRTFLAAFLSLLVLTPATAAEKTTLSYVTWNADFGYIMAAVDKGYFADEGIDVELVVAGGGVAIPAMISNGLDFSGSGSTAISAILKGARLKVLMVGQDRPGWQLWSVHPDPQDITDLKDQQIGVISRGDSGEIAMRYLLMKHKLPGNYVAFTPLGNGTGRLAAISTGAIPANLMVWGEVEKLKTQGGLAQGHLISNLSTEFRMVFNGLATSDRMIHERPDVVLHMVRALLKGQTYVRSFRSESIAMMARYSKSEEKDAASDYDHILPSIARDGTVDAGVRANEVSLRSEMLEIPAGSMMKPQDVFDFLPAREALTELTDEGWKPTP
jgi:NitT/TauT family transport system substrate-binding protein